MKFATSMMILFAVTGTAIATPAGVPTEVPTTTLSANPAQAATRLGNSPMAPGVGGVGDVPTKRKIKAKARKGALTPYQEARVLYKALERLERWTGDVFVELQLKAQISDHMIDASPEATTPVPVNPVSPQPGGRQAKIRGPDEPTLKTLADGSIGRVALRKTQLRESKHINKSMKTMEKKVSKILRATSMYRREARKHMMHLRNMKVVSKRASCSTRKLSKDTLAMSLRSGDTSSAASSTTIATPVPAQLPVTPKTT